MPYLGRAPTVANNVTGDLAVSGSILADGQISGGRINHKLALDGSDASSPQANEYDHFIFEDGGTDGSGTNAGDNLLLEDITPSQSEVSITSISAGGTSGQFLQSQGSLTAPTFATAALEYVSRASQDEGSVYIEFTNMVDGFDYIYVLIDAQCTQLYADFEVLLGTNSSTYRTSNYLAQSFHSSYSSGQTSFEETDSITLVNDAAEGMGTATDTGVKCGEVTLYNPANSSDQTAWKHDCTHLGGSPQIKHEYGGGYYSTAEAHTCVKFRCFQGGSARTTTGSILQYRRKRS